MRRCTLLFKEAIILNYILSTRPFRTQYAEKINQLSSNYQFVYAENLPESFQWEKVVITIGWNKDWANNLLQPTTNLKWVQSISAGVDYLPLKAFEQQKILLSNGSGIHAQSISDHVLGILLMKTRGLFQSLFQQQTHDWQAKTISYNNLSEQVITIIGAGQIGQELARKLTLFGCTVNGINTNGRATPHFTKMSPLRDLYDCAKESDFLINILPLTPETHHLYDERFFQAMKSTASFINVGRGPSVDNVALLNALKNNELAFASIDVADPEPLPEEDPLWNAPNLFITPHISGLTAHFQELFMNIFLENFSSFLENQKLSRNQVSFESGY